MKKILSWVLILCVMISLVPNVWATTDGFNTAVPGDAGGTTSGGGITKVGSRYKWAGWKLSIINPVGANKDTQWDVTTKAARDAMRADIELSYSVRFPNTDDKNCIYGLSNKKLVSNDGSQIFTQLQSPSDENHLYGNNITPMCEAYRFNWHDNDTYSQMGEEKLKISNVGNKYGVWNFAAEYVWYTYFKDNAPKKDQFDADTFMKDVKGGVLRADRSNGTTITVTPEGCNKSIKALFAMREYAPEALKCFVWDSQKIVEEGFDEGCESVGMLGALVTMYMSIPNTSTFSEIRSSWYDKIYSFALQMEKGSTSQKSFKPLAIVLEPCMVSTLTADGTNCGLNTTSEMMGWIFGGKRDLLYNPPVEFKDAAKWSTEELLIYLHGQAGVATCCGKNFADTGIPHLSTMIFGNKKWSCQNHSASLPFTDNPFANPQAKLAYAVPGLKYGYSVVGTYSVIASKPIDTPKLLSVGLNGRSGIKCDPITKKTTDKFSEAVTVTINMKQEDNDKFNDATSWEVFKQTLQQKPADLKITVWLKRDEVNVTKSVGDYQVGKQTPISLEELDQLMTGKKELIYMDLVEGNTPRKYKYSAGINIAWSGAGYETKTILLRQEPRDCFASFYSEKKEPHYYSEVETPYAEIKEGTINNETFNAMQGVPTTRNLYFACGGSEYVVQMECKLVTNQSASRQYSMSYTSVNCDLCGTNATCGCVHMSGDPPSACGGHCSCNHHSPCQTHTVSDTMTWTQQITGFSYLQITDCKVWELSQAKVDGMRELLNTDVVTATVQATAPQALFNIAQGNTAQQGRLYHTYQPGAYDSATLPSKSSDNSCTSHTANNYADLAPIVSGIKDKVTCVSDYLVLRTSNGDQAIVYYEYDCDTEMPIGEVTGSSITAKPIKFTKSITEDMVWKANTQTSAGISMQASDITYGGYNGDFMDIANKYVSTGSSENINVSSLTISKPSYKGGSVTNSGSVSGSKATAPFKLAKYSLDIPDTKRNGEYITGRAQVFYKNLLNYGGVPPFYPIESCSGFNGQGFKLDAVYGKVAGTNDKINNVVVHNPTSTEDACIIALPASRDQRTAEYKDMEQPKQAADETCPCTAEECPYSTLNCQYTGSHVHTSDCYALRAMQEPVPFTHHAHTYSCPYMYGHEWVGYVWVDTGQFACWHCNRCAADIYQEAYPSLEGCPNAGKSGYVIRHYIDEAHTRYRTHFSLNDSVCDMCGQRAGDASWVGPYTIYQCGYSPLNSYNGSTASGPKYVEKFKVPVLSCTEPHHAFGSNWKSYTKGYAHADGSKCTGDTCTNTSALKLFKEVTPSALTSSGYIVQHSSGQVHVSISQTTCDTCGQQISKVLGKATDGNSVPLTNTSHYEFGNEVCYDACCDDKRHEINKTDVMPSTGGSLDIGEFINLDYGFTVYFPNEGDFFGDGVLGSASTSKIEGAGYVDNMDITEWVKDKYVVFPFDVVSEWNNTTCISGIPIHLPINESTYKFYCCVSNPELDNARCKFVMIPINNVSGNVDNNVPSNYARYGNLSAAHSGYKEQFIDVVGRIGAMTIEDTGDFRFSELFKNRVEPVKSWIIPNVVAKVDTTSQRFVMTDTVDVRGEDISKVTNFGDTYQTSPERRQNLIRFPLVPSANNKEPLMKQPLRPGYPVYMDLTTIGNYYGENYTRNDGKPSNYKVQITPYYYHLNLQTGKWTPVDCYINVNNVYKSINLFGNTGEAGYNFATPMNWLEESGRRNSTQEILDRSMIVRDEYKTTIPAGTNIYTGNAQRIHLRDVTRNFVGAETQNMKNHDPSNLIFDSRAIRQVQRYNFSLKLPSSVAFVERGKTCTQENIDALRKQSSVVVCAVEVFAAGDVWNLKYTGETLNRPFKITPESGTYDPVGGPGLPPGDKPIIAVYSISKTSKDDLEVVGKH